LSVTMTFSGTSELRGVQMIQPRAGLSIVAGVTILLCSLASGQTLKFTPIALHFNSVVVNSTSTKTIAMKNKGTSAVAISSISSSLADYAVTHNCPISPATLAGGGSCTITVTFTPQTVGARNAILTIESNAIGNPQNVPLTGTGTPAITLAPGSLAFGPVL